VGAVVDSAEGLTDHRVILATRRQIVGSPRRRPARYTGIGAVCPRVPLIDRSGTFSERSGGSSRVCQVGRVRAPLGVSLTNRSEKS